MPEEFQVVDVWVGQFNSNEFVTDYLSEKVDENDDLYLLFAQEQGVGYFNTDYLEFSFHKENKAFIDMISGHSFSNSYLDEVKHSFESLNDECVNTVLLVWNCEVKSPKSVQNDNYYLHYLGRYSYVEHKAACEKEQFSIPDIIYLDILDGKHIVIDGIPSVRVEIQSPGAIIGVKDVAGDGQFVDVSSIPSNNTIADNQIKIYRDVYNQWIVEDVGMNGSTKINGEVFVGEKSYARDRMIISLGDINMRWTCP